MPVIRYRTRDLTRLLPPTARAMRRIDRISGRSDDMLIIRGVNVFPSNIEAVLAKEEKLAPHYLLELRRPGSLDELDVLVETRTALGGSGRRRTGGNGTTGGTLDKGVRRGHDEGAGGRTGNARTLAGQSETRSRSPAEGMTPMLNDHSRIGGA